MSRFLSLLSAKTIILFLLGSFFLYLICTSITTSREGFWGFGPNYEDYYHDEQRDYNTERDRLGAETKKFGTEKDELGAETKKFGTEKDELGAETKKFSTERDELGAETKKFGTERDELGAETKKFGTERDELGTETKKFGTERDELNAEIMKFGIEQTDFDEETKKFDEEVATNNALKHKIQEQVQKIVSGLEHNLKIQDELNDQRKRNRKLIAVLKSKDVELDAIEKHVKQLQEISYERRMNEEVDGSVTFPKQVLNE